MIPRESTFLFFFFFLKSLREGTLIYLCFPCCGCDKRIGPAILFPDGALGWHTYPPCSSSSEDKFLVHYEKNMMCLKVLQFLINLTSFPFIKSYWLGFHQCRCKSGACFATSWGGCCMFMFMFGLNELLALLISKAALHVLLAFPDKFSPKSQCTWGPLWNKCLKQHLKCFWWISTTWRQKLKIKSCAMHTI